MLQDMFQLGEQPYTDEDAAWDDFVANHPQGSFLQSTAWARLKGRFGWQTQRVWLKKDDRFVAGAQLMIRSAALGIVRLAYVPHGPLVNWDDSEQVGVLFNQLDQAAYQRRAGMLKIEPLLWESDWAPEHWTQWCAENGLRPSDDTIQPPRTVLVDLTGDEAAILAAMKQKTRYNIRLAARKGVSVRRGDARDIPLLNALLRETGQRNEFGVHAPQYYQALYELMGPERVALFVAQYEERPLAAVLIVRDGRRAIYLAGGSSSEERQRMPAYAIQWAAMRWARAQGCTEYDLWGAPDASVEQLEEEFKTRQDGLWPVYRFKRGFGGRVARTVGCADRVYNKRFDRVYQWWRRRG